MVANYRKLFCLLLILLFSCSCSNQQLNSSKEIDSMITIPFYFEINGREVDSIEKIDEDTNTNEENAKTYDELIANWNKMTDDEKLNYIEQNLKNVIQRHDKGESIIWDEEYVNKYVKKYFPNIYPKIQQQIEQETNK